MLKVISPVTSGEAYIELEDGVCVDGQVAGVERVLSLLLPEHQPNIRVRPAVITHSVVSYSLNHNILMLYS